MPSSAPAGDAAGAPAANLAQTERGSLCDLLDDVGPHAPTLAGDWDTFHLAAHLSLRERNPLQLLKLALAGGFDQAVDELVATSDYSRLVRDLRSGPPAASLFSLPQIDRNANALEFFVHHEDVRRAQQEWTVRELPGEAQAELWARIRVFAKVLMRRSPVGVELARTDAPDTVKVAKESDPVVIRGTPSELTLFAFGRRAVASVEFEGSPRAVSAIRDAKFGI